MMQAPSKAVDSKVFVVVPVFNRKFLTQRFLQCMRQQTFDNFQVIVVDDGSTDGTADLIAAEFKEVQLLRGDGNLWWTRAANLGVRHAMSQASCADAVLIINDDLEVDTDYLQVIYGQWKSHPKTLVGSVIVDIRYPELIEDGGTLVNWWTAKFTRLNAGAKLSEFDKEYSVEVSLLTGRGTLIPIEVLHAIGLFDENHFQQCGGDTELPVRAKKAGFSLIVSYAAVIKSHLRGDQCVNVPARFKLAECSEYFFGVRSACRLKYRLYFSLQTACNPIAFVSFFAFDLLRVTLHFLLRLRLA